MNYSGNSLNRTLPSAAAGAHVKAPHLTHNTFGGLSSSHVTIKPIDSSVPRSACVHTARCAFEPFYWRYVSIFGAGVDGAIGG